jgi:hypothetical protein
MPTPIQAYHGVLIWSFGEPYAVVQGLRYLMMYDPPSSGVFQRAAVRAVANHYADLPNGSAVSISAGFVQEHDVDGSGNIKKVLHVLRF